MPDWTLVLRERGYGGALDLRCVTGCADAEVRAALERDSAEARIEAAEAREAEAWEILAQLRTLTVRALELAASVQSRRVPDELKAAA